MANDFQAGDRVKFLDFDGEGVVIRYLDNDQILVESSHGFEEAHFLNDILPIDSETDRVSAYRHIPVTEQSSSKKVKPSSSAKNIKKNGQYWEVDLHIETILDRYQHLSNYEIVQIQLKKCKNAVERAIQKNVYKLIIVHGKGSGVLREEVHQLLNNYSVEIRDSKFQDYGGGATEVFFYR